MNVSPARRAFALGLRFGLVGLFNSAVHAGLVAILGLLVAARDGWIAILVAWAISLPIGYLTQAKLVWRRDLSWTGFVKLCISQVPSIALSTAGGAVAGWLGLPLFWQEAIAIVVGAGVSFVLQRFWVFRAPRSTAEMVPPRPDDVSSLPCVPDTDERA